jgi:phage-related minor tail protein
VWLGTNLKTKERITDKRMDQLIIPIFSVVFSIIGYFLKQVHSDLKKVREDLQKVVTENGKNRGRIELVEQENRLKLQRIEEVTQNEIKHLAEQVNELTTQVRRLIELNTRQTN